MKKRLLSIAIFILIVIGINFVSAALCKGYDYYYDCDDYRSDYRNDVYEYYPSYPPYTDRYSYTYSDEDFHFKTRGKKTYIKSKYGPYFSVYSEDNNYMINKYYPYNSYEYRVKIREGNDFIGNYKHEEYYTRQMSYPEA